LFFEKITSDFAVRKALPSLGRVGWGFSGWGRLLNVPQHIFEAQTFAQTFASFD